MLSFTWLRFPPLGKGGEGRWPTSSYDFPGAIPRVHSRATAVASRREVRGARAVGARGAMQGAAPRSAPAEGAASTGAHGCPEGPPSRNPCPFVKPLTSRAWQRACQFNVAKTQMKSWVNAEVSWHSVDACGYKYIYIHILRSCLGGVGWVVSLWKL